MPIQVADGTAAWWAGQWVGPDAGESEEGYVVLRLDRPATDQDVSVLEAAVERINELARTRWLDLDDQPTIGRKVVQAGRDLVWEIATQHPEGPVGWLDAIAADLTGLGWTGRIETWTLPDPGPLNQLPTGEKVPSALIAIAWATPNGSARAPWRTDETVIPVVVDLALDVLTGYGPGRNVAEHGVMSSPTDTELPELLSTALRGDLEPASPLVWVHRYTPQLNVAVIFHRRGHLLIALHAPAVELPDRMRDLAHRLARDVRIDADWMLLLEDGGGSDFARSFEFARDTKLPAYYRHHRDQDRRVLPDAFGWQVITTEHLARAADLTGWQLTDLPGGRHVLQAPRLEDWLLPDPERPDRLTIATGALEDARLRFGDLIFRSGSL